MSDSARRRIDLAVAVATGLYLCAVLLDSDEVGWLRLLGLLAALGQGAALWWRRSHPEAVMAATLVGSTAYHFAAPEGVFPYAGLIALGSLAAARRPAVSLPALIALTGVTALNFASTTTEDASFAMAFPVVAWALGEAVRNRRAAINQASRRAAADEQARISRDIHDVIAHTVSVIVVQAAAADDVFDDRPDLARQSLRSIEAAGREALAQLRRMLAAPGGADGPAPDLRAIDDLAQALGPAGLDVEIVREGAGASAPRNAEVGAAAFRIVQEALTNALRHSGAGAARVRLHDDGQALLVEVADDGPHTARPGSARPPGGAGAGIAGMRARAEALGGTLTAAPAPGGGFRVGATLPWDAR